MIKWGRGVLVVAALACFSVAQASGAAAEPAASDLERMTYPVDFVTGVSCVGEGVHVVGEVTYVVQAVEPSAVTY